MERSTTRIVVWDAAIFNKEWHRHQMLLMLPFPVSERRYPGKTGLTAGLYFMSCDVTNNAARGCKIALFPGAFRPPHIAHYLAVCEVASQPDIDEVVIIITNRLRNIPGTTKALDPRISQEIWKIFLRDSAKVRVEVAPGSGVRHAIAYLDRLAPGDQLVFCIGEADFGDGDVRFDKIEELVAQSGIRASVYAVPPTGSLLVRATSVRATLARGETGRSAFVAAMPDHLSDKECERVWRICRDGMREMSELAGEDIDRHLRRAGIDNITKISIVKPGKTDPVFRVALGSGNNLYVKYANDTVKAASFDDPTGLKPRERLSAERRAIKWLRKIHRNSLELPRVVYFNKQLKLLAMSEVCSGGAILESELGEANFDPQVAAQAARFLARNHCIAKNVPALWGDEPSDKRHWLGVLKRGTSGLGLENPSSLLCEQLMKLRRESEAASERRYMHLDFLPKNILVRDRSIGVIDLELSSCFGDPAFELGRLIGAYIRYSIEDGSLQHCREAVTLIIQTYRELIGRVRPSLWQSIHGRVLGFTGAALLDDSIGRFDSDPGAHMATAETLLGLGFDMPANEPVEQLIFEG